MLRLIFDHNLGECEKKSVRCYFYASLRTLKVLSTTHADLHSVQYNMLP